MIARLHGYTPAAILILVLGSGILSMSLLLGFLLRPFSAIPLMASFVLLMLAGFASVPTPDRPLEGAIRRALWVLVVAQLVLLLVLPPSRNSSDFDPLPFRALLIVAIALAASFLPMPVRGLQDLRLWGLVASYLAAGAWVIAASPYPQIDVHIVQQMGVELFLQGENPYAIRTYPDIYGSDSPFYAPGMAKDGFLTFGFPYAPLSFLLAVPGYVLLDDHRFSLLIAMAASALFIAAIRRNETSVAAGLLLLFNPATFHLLEHAWIEPYGVALLALTVLLASRAATTTSAIGLGLVAVAKQTLVPVLLIGALLLGRNRREMMRIGLLAMASGLLVSLPLAVWSIRDFIESAVTLQLRQPFRPESLTVSAWLSDGRQPGLPVLAAFVGMAAVIVAAYLRLPRTVTGFAIAVAATYFTFFLLSKYAFANYYLFVLAAMCCAVAASEVGPGTRRQLEPE